MKCPFCQQEIEENDKFCMKCGNRIPRCPTCGRVMNANDRFCEYDGTPIPKQEEPKPAAVKPDGQGGKLDAPISAEAPTAAVSRPERRRMEAAQREAARKKRQTAIFAGLLIVVALVTLIVGLFLMGRGSSDALFQPKVTKPAQTDERTEPTETEKQTQPTEEETPDTTAPAETTEATTAPTDTVPQQTEPATEPTQPPTQPQPTELDPDERILYIIMNSDTILFTAEDLEGFDEDMCILARNGIYARHGRKFKSQSIQEYFEQFEWYVPTIEPDNFSDQVFNYIESHNIATIRDYERANF